MRMYDVIQHKRDCRALGDEELRFFVEGYTRGDIPDYQASALLMAIFLNGMDERETAALTDYMARSGDMVDLSPIPGIKVDKHSTGGVGDKTTLIVGPIVAAAGGIVAKMSGRGLGFSGGTVDKLEAIPGFETSISRERFFDIVKETGVAVIGQSENIAPADKKLYALRDVTATVESLPLIASSIMSKKLAAGSDAILLDVKTGSGAFMKTLDQSIALANAMVQIGVHHERRMMALVTDMDAPLGCAVGNALEVIEAVHTLRGNGPADLLEVCVTLASHMLFLSGKGTIDACRACALHTIESGAALARFCAMAEAQGGDSSVLRNTTLFRTAPIVEPLRALQSGYIQHMDTEKVGMTSVSLGAGRTKKDDEIDLSAGLVLAAKPGDYVERGTVIAHMHTSSAAFLKEASALLESGIVYGAAAPAPKKHVYARISSGKTEML